MQRAVVACADSATAMPGTTDRAGTRTNGAGVDGVGVGARAQPAACAHGKNEQAGDTHAQCPVGKPEGATGRVDVCES